jgi:hypothetical protein
MGARVCVENWAVSGPQVHIVAGAHSYQQTRRGAAPRKRRFQHSAKSSPGGQRSPDGVGNRGRTARKGPPVPSPVPLAGWRGNSRPTRVVTRLH